MGEDVIKVYYEDIKIYKRLEPKFKKCGFTIVPDYFEKEVDTYLRYKRMKYDPLTIDECKSCLEDFIRKVAIALIQMQHSSHRC